MSLKVAYKNEKKIEEDQDQAVDDLMHLFIRNFRARKRKQLKTKSTTHANQPVTRNHPESHPAH